MNRELWPSWRPVSERVTSEARAWGPGVAMDIEAKPMWHAHMCLAERPHPLSTRTRAIGLTDITELLLISEVARIIY